MLKILAIIVNTYLLCLHNIKSYLNLCYCRFMKKLFVLLIALFVLNSLEGYGQINGSTCNNPLVVNSLPFNDAGNTSSYGSNYLSSDVPPLATGAITNGTGSNSYLSGDEVVYAYT